jgi:glycosyltransferase involved in cell wall biosynthesis
MAVRTRSEPSPPQAAIRETLRAVRVLFLAPGDVSKGRVEPISWMQTCHAYAERGADVTLVTLRVRRPDAISKDSVWEHFGLDRSFRIVNVPTLLGNNAPTFWFRLWAGLSSLGLALLTVLRQVLRPNTVVVHARTPVLAAPLVLARRLLPKRRRPLLVLETHTLPTTANGWIVRRVDLVVVNSQKLALDVGQEFSLPPERVLFAPLGPYNRVRRHDKMAARDEVALAREATIACYAGKMTEDHNEFLLATAAELADKVPRFLLLLVGGNPRILEWTRQRVTQIGLGESVILTGFVAPSAVDLYLAAADVLVYHMPSSLSIFPYCTPAKGYDYQAAHRPIVGTDIPLFEEVFGPDGERAIRVTERTPQALSDGVVRALELEDGGRAMVERAAAWIKERTWERRTDSILRAMGVSH